MKAIIIFALFVAGMTGAYLHIPALWLLSTISGWIVLLFFEGKKHDAPNCLGAYLIALLLLTYQITYL